MASKYHLIKALAEGGMARVYLGLFVSDEGIIKKIYAIKQIRPEFSTNEEFITMFRDEASVCQGLQNANVVQVFDFIKLDNTYALIMEYVHGVELTRLAESFHNMGSIMPIPMILYIGIQVARGLHFIHTSKNPITGEDLNIVHRDISPSNVLISAAGEIKISDFGIAKTDYNTHETAVGVIKGKFSYSSPEQINGKHVEKFSDIYSLGVVLWELLSGKRMFTGLSDVDLIKAVSEGKINGKIRDHNPAIPKELEQIIEKCLEISPLNRYQSAGELSDKLNEFLHKTYGPFSVSNISGLVKKIAKDELEERDKIIQKAMSEAATYEIEDQATQILETTGANEVPQKIAVNATNAGEQISITEGQQKLQIQVGVGNQEKEKSLTYEQGVDLLLAPDKRKRIRLATMSNPKKISTYQKQPSYNADTSFNYVTGYKKKIKKHKSSSIILNIILIITLIIGSYIGLKKSAGIDLLNYLPKKITTYIKSFRK